MVNISQTKEQRHWDKWRKAGAVGTASEAGEAYAFFNYNGPNKDIIEAMPQVRENASSPVKLELSLREGVNRASYSHKDLRAIAYDAKDMGMSYVIKANLKGASNRQTASELGDILKSIYQSPLYDNREFRGDIFYQKEEHYVAFR